MMNKYKVIWYVGCVCQEEIPEENIIKQYTVEAEDIKSVKELDILTEAEKKKFEVNIEYCLRCIAYDNPNQHWYDYGSYSRFIYVKKVN